MIQVNVAHQGTSTTETVELSPAVFGRDFNEPLIHQVVTSYMANGRSDTKQQKNRSSVRGGGAKPWRQKGTGRARAGSIRSPIWRGGARAFAAGVQNHQQKVNRKMFKGAIQSILSELLRQERLIVVKDIVPEMPKTKELIKKLEKFDAKRVLILIDDFIENLYLASRNLPSVLVREVSYLDPVSLLKVDKVIISLDALNKLDEVLA